MSGCMERKTDGVDVPAAPSPVIVLNDEQWAHFMDTMNNPAEPTEALKRGARLLDELRAQRAADVKACEFPACAVHHPCPRSCGVALPAEPDKEPR